MLLHLLLIRHMPINRLPQYMQALPDIRLLPTNLLAYILYSIIRECTIYQFRPLSQDLANLTGCVLWKDKTLVAETRGNFEGEGFREVDGVGKADNGEVGFLVTGPVHDGVDHLLLLGFQVVHLVNHQIPIYILKVLLHN